MYSKNFKYTPWEQTNFAMCRCVKSKWYDRKLLKACKHVLKFEDTVIGHL